MPLTIVQDIPTLRRVEPFLLKAPLLGFDTEYTDKRIDLAEIVGAGFSDGDHHVYIPLGHRTRADIVAMRSPALFDEPRRLAAPPQVRNCPFEPGLDLVRRVVKRKDVTLVAHNMKAEIGVLREYRIEPECMWRDTMLCNWLLTGRGGNDLATVVNSYFPGRNRSETKFEDVAVDGQIALAPIAAVAKYCAQQDAGDAVDLWKQHFEGLMESWGLTKVFTELEMELPPIIQAMERVGVLWDLDYLRESDVSMKREMAEIDERIYDFVGRRFNLGSSQQLSQVMFRDKSWWDAIEEPGAKGHYSTRAEVLIHQAKFAEEEAGRVIAQLLLRRRKLDTLCQRYTLSLVEAALEHPDHRVHTNFLQHGTDTGRFSSNGPNLQNIPRPQDDDAPEVWLRNLPKIRRAVIAADGWRLAGVDYSQIELRVMAHESRDPRLLQAYQNNEDIHKLTASQVGSSRQEAKAINFGLIYLMSPQTLAHHLGIDLPSAQRYHTAYFQAFRGVTAYHLKIKEEAERLGFIRTITGRFREIPNINLRGDSKDAKAKRRAAWRVAVNTRIQGSAADIIKIAIRNLVRELKARGWWLTKVRLLLQVHDELVFEIRNDLSDDDVLPVIQHALENAVKLRVPLVAIPHSGANWLEIK